MASHPHDPQPRKIHVNNSSTERLFWLACRRGQMEKGTNFRSQHNVAKHLLDQSAKWSVRSAKWSVRSAKWLVRCLADLLP
eukprot:CAMPEP_0113847390 /NCGR_PEP_ID=MMETSP0372-20130328/1845_1 /TAXON_ID=340204 /ORGANISM="Lankesteria abbotti" /LENGTH=80 /DNA_ID=CAMNT_0000816657 /DNA_START=496 /DNA_END=734 /DNA_ORIENTATION=+ /assembly_acc=CAM_ASM_000359